MEKKKLILFLILFMVVFQSVFGLSKVLPVKSNEPDPELENTVIDLTEKVNKFSFELFDKINKKNGDQNIFVSPLSVTLALGMVYNGSEGVTATEIAKVLNISDIQRQIVNNSFRELQSSLISEDQNAEFLIGNSIWHDYNFIFEQEFLNTNEKYYNAYIKGLNFRSLETAGKINKWVSDQTKGKISKIVGPEIDPMLVMYLINAMYFKGSWEKEFDLKRSRLGTFNSEVKCMMMSISEEFPYYKHESFQAIQLPYADSDFSMTIFLPNKSENLDEMIEYINHLRWDYFNDQFEVADGFLQMPRFSMEYEINLNQHLKDLGMVSAFNSDANFDLMTPEELFISKVKHKTYIKVNEEGTEAAAVTSVGMETVSIKEKTFIMQLNRPYYFLINYNDTVVFIGKMMNPSE